MELYVKMTDEEYEEYKVLKEKQYLPDNENIQEYLKRNGFEERYVNEGYNPIIGKPTKLTVYEKDNCTIKIEEKLL